LKKFTLVALSAAVLAACGTRPPAPVVDRTVTPGTREPVLVQPPAPVPAPAPVVAVPPTVSIPDTHVVRAGETIYSVARLYNLNPRDVALLNGVPQEVVLRPGQVLRLTQNVAAPPPAIVATPIPAAPTPPPAPLGDVKREPKAVKIPYTDEAFARLKGATASSATLSPAPGRPAAAPTPAPSATVSAVPPAAAAPAPAATADADNISWAWPNAGKVTKKFSENSLLRGLALEGKTGSPVFAAAAGRVIYASEGLRGYGKVVILRHNEQYTSVYGHNSAIVVKEGDLVRRGQKIAEVGSTETESPKLHFEVRRSGKAVDPEKLLPAR
jgi:lipoprotein NlpD